ncbi:hypothetical protein [Novosphingobium rosa]|uniref:hypothetical protein n=1 Tax=Novosphingobium rosa TaxID=76978 RepID=UPI00083395C8|nr:hypothetical protein [Novosphingobium rosa]
MLTRLLALSASLLVASPALAEQIYEGTAGSARIVLALDADKSEVSGHYFYRATRLDIDLAGERHGQAITLTSEITRDRLALTQSGPALTGTLTTAKGQSLSVSLHPAATPRDLPADLPPRLEPYEKLQLAGLSLTPQQPAVPGGKTIRWYREGVTGLRLFRLESGYPAPAMAAINHALARQHWANVSAFLGCTGSDGRPGLDTSKADTPWLGAHIVSYTWSSSWSCARAAHPDFGTEGHSFDAVAGRELTLDAVLPFGKSAIPPQDSDGWYTYRSKVFAPRLVALLRRYHPQAMTAPAKGDEDGCDYTQSDVWNFPSWSLGPKGLWVGASFPRVMRSCDNPEWAIIPWSALAVKP